MVTEYFSYIVKCIMMLSMIIWYACILLCYPCMCCILLCFAFSFASLFFSSLCFACGFPGVFHPLLLLCFPLLPFASLSFRSLEAMVFSYVPFSSLFSLLLFLCFLFHYSIIILPIKLYLADHSPFNRL